MNLVSLLAIGIIGAFLSLVLKSYKPELALAVSVATAVYLLFSAVLKVVPSISGLRDLLQSSGISLQYLSVLLKSVGICYLTQFACDICRDSGQNAVAGKLELIGRIAVCAVALPLYRELLAVAEKIIGKVR